MRDRYIPFTLSDWFDQGAMMNASKHWKRVRKFHKKAKQYIGEVPHVPPAETRELRAKLIMEEALELISAMGVEIRAKPVYEHKWSGGTSNQIPLTYEHLTFTTLPQNKVDLIGVADGLADLSVVNTGTMVSFGIQDKPLLKEVDENNLGKFEEGNGYRRADGKWVKDPEYPAPRIEKVLRKQGWEE